MCKLCLGAVLIFAPIFSFAITLPSGYTQLEYIQSNDNHPRIEVDSIKNIAENEIEFQTQIMWVGSSVNNGGTLEIGFGSSSSSSYNAIRTFGVTYDGYWKTNQTKITPNKKASTNVLYDISYKMYSNKVILEVKNGDTTEVNSTVNYNIPFDGNSIFYPTDYIGYGLRNARIYFSKVYRDGVLVFNGIPAKRNSDNAVGLYDTISNTFYKQIASQSGSGYNFIAGPVVETYTELEYLELQGEAYFNTNVYLSKDMDIEYEVMLTYLPERLSGVFCSARSMVDGYGTGLVVAYNYNNTLIDFFGVNNSTGRWFVQDNGLDYITQTNKKYKLSITNKVGTFSADGTVIDTHTYVADGTSPITVPFYINAFNNGGNIVFRNDNSHIRFYHFSASGVADIVPAKRDSDNVLGLYNKTTGEFLEKIGSGTLVAGPAITSAMTINITWGGLSEPDASGTCTYGETFTAPSTAPTAPSGLKFLGWIPR